MHQLQATIRKQIIGAWRYRWPAILFFWLVCAGGWAAVFSIPNQYESSARMYVDADVVLTPLLRGLAVDSSLAAQVDLLQRTLLSRPNLEKLISKTDLELQLKAPSDRQAMVERLGTEIRIIPQTKNLFTITYRNPSPRLAYDVVQNMLSTFVESKTGNNRADLENAGRFLQDQISTYEAQLRDAERKRADFRTKYVDLLPTDTGGTKLETAAASLNSLLGQLKDAEARKIALAKELASTPAMVVTENDTAAAAAAAAGPNRLQTAERHLGELRLRLTENHPDVIAARNLVAGIKSGAAGPNDAVRGGGGAAGPRSRSAPNPVYEQMKVRTLETDSLISSLTRQVADATKERQRLEDIARGAPGLQAEFVNMNRDYDVLRKNYESLLARRESMRISSAAEVSADNVKVQIIDPPQVSQTPVAPKRLLLVSGVLLAGLAAGATLALLLVQMDQSFHSTDDLRDLGYPVAGGVSMLTAAIPFGQRALALGSFCVALAAPAVVYGGLMWRLLRAGASA